MSGVGGSELLPLLNVRVPVGGGHGMFEPGKEGRKERKERQGIGV